MIEFRLSPRSGVATYLQLVHQVRHAVRLGILHPGDQLPTVKEVRTLGGNCSRVCCAKAAIAVSMNDRITLVTFLVRITLPRTSISLT